MLPEVSDVEAKDDSALEGRVDRDSDRDLELARSLALDNRRRI